LHLEGTLLLDLKMGSAKRVRIGGRVPLICKGLRLRLGLGRQAIAVVSLSFSGAAKTWVESRGRHGAKYACHIFRRLKDSLGFFFGGGSSNGWSGFSEPVTCSFSLQRGEMCLKGGLVAPKKDKIRCFQCNEHAISDISRCPDCKSCAFFFTHE
jgi:hypothetical protein